MNRAAKGSLYENDSRLGEWASPRRPAQLIMDAKVPKYTEAAQKAGISGVVLVEVHVEKGRIVGTEAVAGDRLPAVAALESIRTWEFAGSYCTIHDEVRI